MSAAARDVPAPLRTRHARLTDDRGMVTVETAAVLPVLVLVAAVAVAFIGVAARQLRAVDAAHVVALAAARGDPHAADLGPATLSGARVSIARSGDDVSVTVSAGTRLGPLAGPDVSARAVAPYEPTGGGADADGEVGSAGA